MTQSTEQDQAVDSQLHSAPWEQVEEQRRAAEDAEGDHTSVNASKAEATAAAAAASNDDELFWDYGAASSRASVLSAPRLQVR